MLTCRVRAGADQPQRTSYMHNYSISQADDLKVSWNFLKDWWALVACPVHGCIQRDLVHMWEIV